MGLGGHQLFMLAIVLFYYSLTLASSLAFANVINFHASKIKLLFFCLQHWQTVYMHFIAEKHLTLAYDHLGQKNPPK
jgi:hypothetical protein